MYTMQIQQEKIGLVRKKKKFFDFFDFRINARGPPKIFDVQFFKILKKDPKNDFTGTWQMLKQTKS